MTGFKLPAWAATALGLVAGVLTYLNQATFGFSTGLKTAVTVGLILLLTLGVGPLLGPAFRNALHLPQWVANLIGSLLAVVAYLIQTAAISGALRGVLVAVLTFAAAVGFAPAAVPIPVAAKKR